MHINRLSIFPSLLLLVVVSFDPVFSQVGDVESGSIPNSQKGSPADTLRSSQRPTLEQQTENTQVSEDTILDITDMDPVEIGPEHLTKEAATLPSKNKSATASRSTPVSPAPGAYAGNTASTVPEDETDALPAGEPAVIPGVNTHITSAQAGLDEENDFHEEDSQVSDEELEFLYQSGSLQEDENPVTQGANRAARSRVTDSYSEESEEIHMLGEIINPGESKRLRWVASETFYGGNLETPVHVINGNKPGLTLCLTAAVHGDELNGVEIVRRLVDSIIPDELSGTIIGVPIVNLLGFTRGSRYLPDRRDLNRYFPGNSRGSSASRIANSFMQDVIVHCDRLVDLHTGSLNRTNMPQLRAHLDNPDVVEFTRHFGSTAVLHSRNIRGNLRTAATNIGIPAVTLELGEPGSLQEKHIEYGVKVIETLLDKLDMVKRRRKWSEPQPVYYSSRWVRVNNGGLLTTTVKVGAKVKRGSTLGIIVNPITSENYEINSPYNGRVLGMSLNQFMLPGYAAFNIGIVTSETEAPLDAQSFECIGTDMAPEQVTDEFDCSADGSDEVEQPYDERDEMIENIE